MPILTPSLQEPKREGEVGGCLGVTSWNQTSHLVTAPSSIWSADRPTQQLQQRGIFVAHKKQAGITAVADTLSDGRALVTHQEAKLCQAEAWGLVDVIREPPWRGHHNVSQAAVACHSERTSSPSVSLSPHNKACSTDLKVFLPLN